jgi:hypothetical protein
MPACRVDANITAAKLNSKSLIRNCCVYLIKRYTERVAKDTIRLSLKIIDEKIRLWGNKRKIIIPREARSRF